MKKLIAVIIVLTLLLYGCAKAPAPETDRNIPPADIVDDGFAPVAVADEQKLAPSGIDVTVTVQEPYETEVLVQINQYAFDNGYSKELSDILSSLEYDEPRCMCTPEYRLTFDDVNYGVKLEDGDSYATFNGMQKSLTDEIKAKISEIFSHQLTRDNYLYTEEKQYSAVITQRNGNDFYRYTFFNDDSVKLLSMLTGAQYTDGELPCQPEFRAGVSEHELPLYGFSLEYEKPFLAKDGKIHYLTDSETDELKRITQAYCKDAFATDYHDYKMPAYITTYPVAEKQYKFQNTDSKLLLTLLESYMYLDVGGNCACPLEYKIHHPDDAGVGLQGRFHVAFLDDCAHVYLEGRYHAIVSKEDGELIKSLIESNCTQSTLLKEKDKFSD